jgi:aryl-alcohol dehydrogenase-like predicted oxidoreductase
MILRVGVGTKDGSEDARRNWDVKEDAQQQTETARPRTRIRSHCEHDTDTAPVYGFGVSEEIVGKAIEERGHREKVFIATKVGLAFVLGAGTGAAMVLHFKALGMLGASLLLITLILHD